MPAALRDEDDHAILDSRHRSVAAGDDQGPGPVRSAESTTEALETTWPRCPWWNRRAQVLGDDQPAPPRHCLSRWPAAAETEVMSQRLPDGTTPTGSGDRARPGKRHTHDCELNRPTAKEPR
jgi:hypothetical protein